MKFGILWDQKNKKLVFDAVDRKESVKDIV